MASIAEAKEIIKGTPISTVIGFYHALTSKGGNYQAICPFHGDTKPSLVVNDQKGIYKCFACGAAGDSIKFVQDKLNLNYIEAVKEIAPNLGITIEEQKAKNPKYDMALRVLQAAARLYKKIAIEKQPKNFNDFLKDRNINQESVTNYQLGYAEGNNVLVNYLNSIPEKERDTAIKMALQLSLIRENKRGSGYYDFYRNRVIFPISDHAGKVRGFSSRAVLKDQKPKYLNSGESFIFDKGNILYGYNLAKTSIRAKNQVIVVEGNMDALMLHQFGFTNSVATQGVALSEGSIRLLSNMTKNIILAMDSDPAGIMAMTKINKALILADIIPKFIDFSPAKDPDEYLNTHGRIELAKKIEEAPTFLDFLINKAIPESIPESLDRKLEILNEVFTILSPLGENLMANEKAVLAAKSLSLQSSNEDIINAYKNYLAKNKEKTFPKAKPAKKIPSKQNHQAAQKQSFPSNTIYPNDNFEPTNQNSNDYDNLPPEDYFNPGEQYNDMPNASEQFGGPIIETNLVSKTEKLILKTILGHPELILNKQITELLDLIEHFEVKRIFLWLKKIYLEIDESDYVLFVKEKMQEALPGEIQEAMASSIFNYEHMKLDSKVAEKMLNDLLFKQKQEALKKQSEKLRAEHKNANSDEDSLKVLNEIQQIEAKLLELKNSK